MFLHRIDLGIGSMGGLGARAHHVFTVLLQECDFSLYKCVLMIIIAPLDLIIDILTPGTWVSMSMI